MTVLSVFKWIGGPGSIGFLVLGSAVGLAVIRLWPRNRRLGRAWLFALYSGYVVLGVPLVACAIAAPFADPLAGRRTVESAIDTLVVFDGDNSDGRVAEARRLWSVAHPESVVASGEQWLLDRLIESGIPRKRLIQDEVSQNTRDQVHYLGTYLGAHPNTRVAVVASRLQMPRIEALARRLGVRPMFYASAVDREPARDGLLRFVPTYSALRVSRDALYERVAIAYYRWQGWIGPAETPRIASAS